MLHLSSVQKKYSQRIILDIPDLKIDKGIHWLKGSNGSGKSTFLKMISGIIPLPAASRRRDERGSGQGNLGEFHGVVSLVFEIERD